MSFLLKFYLVISFIACVGLRAEPPPPPPDDGGCPNVNEAAVWQACPKNWGNADSNASSAVFVPNIDVGIPGLGGDILNCQNPQIVGGFYEALGKIRECNCYWNRPVSSCNDLVPAKGVSHFFSGCNTFSNKMVRAVPMGVALPVFLGVNVAAIAATQSCLSQVNTFCKTLCTSKPKPNQGLLPCCNPPIMPTPIINPSLPSSSNPLLIPPMRR